MILSPKEASTLATPTGFGKPQSRSKAKSTDRRTAAASRLDDMRSKGMPEFEVYIRVKDKQPWYPIGALAVNRSNQIERAIFDNENDLRQGAFRLFPRLKKQQANLEYGYRVRAYKDEPITVAVKPNPPVPGPIQGVIDNVRDGFSNLVSQFTAKTKP
jgi:hypothetical protein